jgi:hypothetical protein
MSTISELLHDASPLKALVFNTDESGLLEHADDLLLFLNRLRDYLGRSTKVLVPISSIDDIIHGLESNPELTLHDRSVRERLLNLFMKLYCS